MISFKRGFFFASLAILMLAGAFFAGYFFDDLLYPGEGSFPILSQSYRILRDHAYDDLPNSPALEYGMIRGMLQAYGDPFTIFVEPVQHELETNNLQGEFGGIGVHFTRDQDGYVVLFPLPDSPALEAGLHEGDRLLSVGSLQVDSSTPLEDIQAALRGPQREKVSVTVGRAPDFNPQTYLVVRVNFPLPSVFWHLDPDEPQVGVIQVNVIAASTPDEIEKAVKDLQARQATHFILDLRNNGGGLLSTGVDTARLFLKEGVVMQQQYRGQKVETFNIKKTGPLADIPLVVLVNHGTASAAEIIAGALQSHGRAQLVGSQTYGKDTIQLVFDLEDGSSLHVTSARWWVPDLGLPADGNGLEPDIVVEDTENSPDAVLAAAVEYLINGKTGK